MSGGICLIRILIAYLFFLPEADIIVTSLRFFIYVRHTFRSWR